MSVIAPDPFTIAYGGLWSVLEANPDFCTLVPEGNRVKFSGSKRAPVKENVQAADLPEVRIVAGGGSCNTHIATGTVQVIKRYSVQVSSGDQRLTAALYPVEWEIVRSFVPAHWEPIVAALKWNNLAQGSATGWGIDIVDLGDNQEGISDSDLARGIKGWSTTWACEARLWFAASVIKPTTSA